jgi:hypothetical protein
VAALATNVLVTAIFGAVRMALAAALTARRESASSA